MRVGRWRRDNPFNPYIVLADVTIATIVVFIVLLISSETRGDGIGKELLEVKEQLKSYEVRDQKRKQLEDAVREKNDSLSPILQKKSAQWQKDGLFVSFASGPNTFLIRIYGEELWDKKTGAFSRKGRINTGTVIGAIREKCEEYLQGRESPTLIEIRVEGHCSEKIGLSSLARSLERANTVRGLFPEKLRRYISITGFGSDRPAYETTPTAVWKQRKNQGFLDDDMLIKRLKALDGGSGEDLSADSSLQSYLDQDKNALTDRVDIILVYSGLLQDNNFVYPRIEGGEIPDWVNDVSTPKTNKKFLKPREESP